eukprot:jgi/Psemu1/55100/gm1.55100_g
MSGIPIGGKTISTSTGRFLSRSPRAPLTSPTIMTPDQQDNTTQEADKEDVSISDLFPSFDQALATFLHDSFDAPKESHCTLCEALIARQYRTWSDFLFIEDDIDALTYKEGDWEERDHYTKEAFRKYWRGIVKANRDSTANRVVVTNHGIPPDGPGRSTKPIDQLNYESWIRQPRDETTFPVLQHDARFEHWLVKFTATLETSDLDTHTFLDPDWPRTALTGYSKALHEEQCAFFWTLLQHVFQGDFSSSCVLYHKRTRDGRQAYFDFVKLHKPVSHPMPPAAPLSYPGPVPVRPPAVGNIVTPRPTPPVSTHAPVHITSSTPAVHNSPPTTACTAADHPTVDNPETPTGLPGSPPTTACKTADHPTVDNPETPTGLPGSSIPGSTADSTSTGTSTYTWKYSPSTDSYCPADIPTGKVPSKRTREPHPTRARTSYPSPANSRWTFYPQSETVVFHRVRSATQPSCIPSLQLPSSGASSKDNVVSSSVRKPLYGASFCPVRKPCAYPVGKPLYDAHHMTYVLPAVCITKRHRDTIKIKLYQLHATLLIANWLYDDVT